MFYNVSKKHIYKSSIAVFQDWDGWAWTHCL